MRIQLGRTGLWLSLLVIALTGACASGPTGPCFDPTDSGGCHNPKDSTQVSHHRAQP
jgi:hypothetical protein